MIENTMRLTNFYQVNCSSYLFTTVIFIVFPIHVNENLFIIPLNVYLFITLCITSTLLIKFYAENRQSNKYSIKAIYIISWNILGTFFLIEMSSKWQHTVLAVLLIYVVFIAIYLYVQYRESIKYEEDYKGYDTNSRKAITLNDFDIREIKNYNIYSVYEEQVEGYAIFGEYNTIIFKKGDMLMDYILSNGATHNPEKQSILLVKEQNKCSQNLRVRLKRDNENYVYYIKICRKHGFKTIHYSISRCYTLVNWSYKLQKTQDKKEKLGKLSALSNELHEIGEKPCFVGNNDAVLENYFSCREFIFHDLIIPMVQNHYKIDESCENIIELLGYQMRCNQSRKTLLINGKQGIGKTTFLKKIITERLGQKPVIVSIWNEGSTKDPLSVISNSLINDMSFIEKIKKIAFRFNFSIFTAIASITLITHFFLKPLNREGLNQYDSFIIMISGLVLIYLILNYIELNLLLFKTGRTTNDRTKFLGFIAKGIQGRILIIEDFERVGDDESVKRWIAEIDALNSIATQKGVRIILTYDEQAIEGNVKIFEDTIKKRVLIAQELQYQIDIEKYKQELIDAIESIQHLPTIVEEYKKCTCLRDIDTVKHGKKLVV